MKEFANQFKALTSVLDDVCGQIAINNYDLIPELMNVLENVIPNIFAINNEIKCFDNNEIIEILNDIVNAFENKDPVLMIDVLKYGLNNKLDMLIEALNNKEGSLYE